MRRRVENIFTVPRNLLGLAMLLAAALMLYESRGQTFYADEWALYANYEGFDPSILLTPDSGNLLLVPEAEDTPERKYVRARVVLGDGHRVLFADPRRFGTGHVLLGDEARDEYFSTRLGVEPLGPEFTPEAMSDLARGRSAPVKAFLLNQQRIAGVGNIYADEALFRARIHPLRPVGALRRGQLADLRDAVVESLELGVDSNGATIDDFRDIDGARGSFQDRFLVHRREGEPCPRCGTTIKKMRAAGRGTYVCEKCQPRPRRR